MELIIVMNFQFVQTLKEVLHVLASQDIQGMVNIVKVDSSFLFSFLLFKPIFYPFSLFFSFLFLFIYLFIYLFLAITCPPISIGNATFSTALAGSTALGKCDDLYYGSPTLYCNLTGYWNQTITGNPCSSISFYIFFQLFSI